MNHIPGIHDNGPRDHGLLRLTLTAYSNFVLSSNYLDADWLWGPGDDKYCVWALISALPVDILTVPISVEEVTVGVYDTTSVSIVWYLDEDCTLCVYEQFRLTVNPQDVDPMFVDYNGGGPYEYTVTSLTQGRAYDFQVVSLSDKQISDEKTVQQRTGEWFKHEFTFMKWLLRNPFRSLIYLFIYLFIRSFIHNFFPFR